MKIRVSARTFTIAFTLLGLVFVLRSLLPAKAEVLSAVEVDAIYAKFRSCFSKIDPQIDPRHPGVQLCGAQTASTVGGSVGDIQKCLAEGRFMAPWRLEEGVTPITYTGFMQCGSGAPDFYASALVTLKDGRWSVSDVGHTRSVYD